MPKSQPSFESHGVGQWPEELLLDELDDELLDDDDEPLDEDDQLEELLLDVTGGWLELELEDELDEELLLEEDELELLPCGGGGGVGLLEELLPWGGGGPSCEEELDEDCELLEEPCGPEELDEEN